MPSTRTGRFEGLHVELVEDDGRWSVLPDVETLIIAAAAAVSNTLTSEAPSATVAFALSSDANVAELNGRFRGKPKPTNVLSFPSPPNSGDHIGDIIIAYETVVREAGEQGISLKDHVQHLAVHGILHLLGYDHEDDTSAERMEALEIEILSHLGVANPYTGALEPVTRA